MTSPETTTGRHAASDTSPAGDSSGEYRAAYHPMLVTQPLSTFYGNVENTPRYQKAAKRLAAVVREYLGVDAPVALTRPLRQMSDTEETNTFNAAELGVKFTQVTASEMRSYHAKLTEVLTGKNRVKLLDGPDYDDLVAEPVVELPDAARLEESIAAGQYVSELGAKRKAAGGTLYEPKGSNSDTASDNAAGGLEKFDGMDEDDLI